MQACTSLDSANKKAAQELLTKTLGSAAIAAPAATAAAAAPSRSATAAAPKAAEPAPRAAASRPGTSRAAAALGGSLSRTASAVEVQEPKGPLLALSTGKTERARKVRGVWDFCMYSVASFQEQEDVVPHAARPYAPFNQLRFPQCICSGVLRHGLTPPRLALPPDAVVPAPARQV
jgi:hypothetical protein